MAQSHAPAAAIRSFSSRSPSERDTAGTHGRSGADNLSHVAADNQPCMVDVGAKVVTRRTARAGCRVRVPPSVAALLQGKELISAKGPVFATAIIAGTMAAKRTSELIPFCHPLPVERVDITVELDADEGVVNIECTVGVSHKTGVEMEALTGASVAALTVYDMCKAVTHEMVIEQTRLLSKTGGKSDFAAPSPPK